MTFDFAISDRKKCIRMLSLYYHESMGKIEENDGKKYLMVDDHMLDGVLSKTKMIIWISTLDDTRILIDTGIKLADKVTLINAVILI